MPTNGRPSLPGRALLAALCVTACVAAGWLYWGVVRDDDWGFWAFYACTIFVCVFCVTLVCLATANGRSK